MIKFYKEDFFKHYGPREKLKNNYQINDLKDFEIWALILGSGTKNKNIIELSKDIVNLLNKIVVKEELNHIEYKLKKIKGIGEITAMKIKAIIELGKRLTKFYEYKYWNGERNLNKTKKIVNKINNQNEKKGNIKKSYKKEYKIKISNSKDVFKIVKKLIELQEFNQEMFIAIYLNSKLEIIKKDILFKGTLDFVNVHPREIFKKAVLYSAHSIIISHNHPSGEVIPSLEDIKMTKRLIRLGKEMGLKIIDHIIVSEYKYRSMLECGDVEFD